MKTCGNCQQIKELNEFYPDSSKAGHRWICKTCDKERIAKIQMEYKSKLVTYWEESRQHSGCLVCGYRRYLGALDFHHRNPQTKSFKLTSGMKKRAWEETTKEIDKCDLLCANHHREEHARFQIGMSFPLTFPFSLS